MLNNISWASYAYAVSIFLIIYYIFVIAVFYRKDLQGLLVRYREQGPRSIDKANSTSQETVDNAGDKLFENAVTNDTHELLLSLQSLIKKGAARKFPKEELLLSLQLRLQNYPAMKDSKIKGNINNFIKMECENNCSIHLTDDEVKVLWGVEVGGAS